MKLYTKKGDSGLSYVARSNKRIPKSSPIFSLLGGLDTLNSLLGLAKTQISDNEIRQLLSSIQDLIFNLGTEINIGHIDPQYAIADEEIQKLEQLIDFFQSKTPELKNFILPGATFEGSLLHLARSVTRDVERIAVKFKTKLKLRTHVLAFLNRLSDFLFALARYIEIVILQSEENIWQLHKSKTSFYESSKIILANK